MLCPLCFVAGLSQGQGIKLFSKKTATATCAARVDSLNALALELLSDLKDSSLLQYSRALEKSLALANTSGDPLGRAIAHRGLGNYHLRFNNPAAAKKHFLASLVVYDSVGQRKNSATVLTGTAQAALAMGDTAAAAGFYQQALEKVVTLNDSFLLADAYRNLGLLYLHSEERGLGMDLLGRAIESGQASKNTGALTETYLALSRYWQQRQAYAEALKFYQRYDSLRETDLQKKGLIIAEALQFMSSHKSQESEVLALQQEQTLLKIAGTASLLVFLTVMAFFVFNNRQKKHHLKELKKLNAEINLQNGKLAKINRELDQFVYSASHDLRSPVTSALGLIEVARLESEKDRMGEYLELQKKTLKKLDNYIRDIIDYSQNNHSDVQSVPVSIKPIAETLFKILSWEEGAPNIGFELSVSQTADLMGDPVRIETVLHNLMSNALRYHHENAPNPWVKVSFNVDSRQALLTVSDNGIGIHPDYRDKVFDMFFRASAAKPGSGLGLFVVREILEKMGGHISVNSVPGQQTDFVVTFPNLLETTKKNGAMAHSGS